MLARFPCHQGSKGRLLGTDVLGDTKPHPGNLNSIMPGLLSTVFSALQAISEQEIITCSLQFLSSWLISSSVLQHRVVSGWWQLQHVIAYNHVNHWGSSTSGGKPSYYQAIYWGALVAYRVACDLQLSFLLVSHHY